MPKIYQEKIKGEPDRYLMLEQDGTSAVLYLVDANGVVTQTIARVVEDGLELFDVMKSACARAGFSPNALDANGRLKVIGQEVEAERMQGMTYPAAAKHGSGALNVRPRPDGCLIFRGESPGTEFVISLSPAVLRDLRDRINRHLAYVEKEGLE